MFDRKFTRNEFCRAAQATPSQVQTLQKKHLIYGEPIEGTHALAFNFGDAVVGFLICHPRPASRPNARFSAQQEILLRHKVWQKLTELRESGMEEFPASGHLWGLVADGIFGGVEWIEDSDELFDAITREFTPGNPKTRARDFVVEMSLVDVGAAMKAVQRNIREMDLDKD